MSNKESLIDSIRTVNPSAVVDFLLKFDETALQSYLTHLNFLRQPRGKSAAWVRTAETPAIVRRSRSQPC